MPTLGYNEKFWRKIYLPHTFTAPVITGGYPVWICGGEDLNFRKCIVNRLEEWSSVFDEIM